MTRLSTMTLVLGAAALAACGGSSPTAPTRAAGAGLDDADPPARVTVRIATAGLALDDDGYALFLNGRLYEVPVNMARMAADLEAGAQTMWLSGLAANCELQGENPRRLSIEPGGHADVTFEVVCFE
jgi:hypothetical protein